MKRPLVGLVAVYAAGIWLGSVVNWPASWLWGVTAGLVVAFGLLVRTRFSLPVLLGLVGCTGLLSERHALTTLPPDDIVRVVEYRDQSAGLRGTIISDPGNSGERLVFFLKLNAVRTFDSWRPVSGRVYVFVGENHKGEALRYGDRVECEALLRVPAAARNPGGFHWRLWLARQGVAFTATVRPDDSYRVLARDRGNWLMALSLRLRDRFEQALRLGLEDEPKLASVLNGLVIGERAEIPPATYGAFQRTGVVHVFSVSGLNVALVAAVVLGALRLVRVPRRWCALAAIPALVLYVLATGARPGAVRSLVMAVVLLVGWALVRPVDVLNSLAGAALALLAFDPMQLFDGGFILSFTVVAAIVALTPRIERRLLPLARPDPLVPAGLVPGWRQWLEVPVKQFARLVSCSMAAWVGLLPLMAEYFHLFSPVSILANVVVVPALGLITALGLVTLLAYPVWPWLTLILNNASFFLLAVMIRAVEWLDRIPWGHWYVQAPPVWVTAAFYAAGILLLNRWWKSAVAVGVAMGMALAWNVWRAPAVEITVLDLKDGPCVFINLPGEQQDVLIDGGGDWGGRREVVPFLRAQGVDRLGTVIVTRADKAHVAGLHSIMAEIPVGQVIHSGMPSQSKYYKQWLSSAQSQHGPLRALRRGAEFAAGPRLTVRVLHPSVDASAKRSDDNSLVLLLDFGGTRVLLMSDAGATVEGQLLKDRPDLHAAIILKGRHNAEPSCSDEFLDAVKPAVVVQCVGRWPSTRYAEPELAQRLHRRGIRFLRTDDTGAIAVRITNDGYSVHPEREPLP